ncbi:ABC transporter substrate-binding protein [Pseudaminobacter soli (ex Li et al. 2025)]|uniref:Amino acid ABC transporter substrate-binding protein n=1 Tax=Pseudaminobacter soli (ex Li et al. 2025) TaxID=1295366 RepID=A0A2P7SJU8_9HYPH|nr:ABC transporter substrate-binding protein [Mesorhizobium soli]PSJ62772.1 amino acid ABC transporter substrate-binding protein [Mesorhizobium soli]
MNRILSGLAAAALMIASSFTVSAQADDLEKIKAAGEMKISMSGQYPPFNFVNEQNEVVGFDASIGKAIAERIGVKGTIVTTAWDGIIAGLLANKYDTIVGSMTITPEREKVVDFVGPYYHAGRAVFVSEESPVKSLEDLKGKKLGVTLGETHEKWAREQGGWDIRTYKGLPELLLELKAGRVDAIVVDNIPVMVAIKETGDKIRKLETPDIEGGSVAIGIAIRKGNPELKAAMQKALDEMLADGSYEKISKEWIGADIR